MKEKTDQQILQEAREALDKNKKIFAEKYDNKNIGHNSKNINQNTSDLLKRYIEGVENYNDRIKEFQGSIKEIFDEAKSAGFDVKTMRKIISMRKLDKSTLDQQEYLLETYKEALGMTQPDLFNQPDQDNE